MADPTSQGASVSSRNVFQPRPAPGVAFYKDPKPLSWVSYSGQDIRAYIQICGKMEWLANLYTLSYSSFRDIVPVRGLGQAAALAHARGWRTVAGSMVFTQFNKDALFDYLSTTAHDRNASGWYPVWVDQIPPFNLVVLCQGEVQRNVYSADWADLIHSGKVPEGSPQSRLVIHKVTMAGGGSTMSVDDMITEGMYNYHALGITPLMDVNDGVINGSPMLTGEDGARLLNEYKGAAQKAQQAATIPTPSVPSMPIGATPKSSPNPAVPIPADTPNPAVPDLTMNPAMPLAQAPALGTLPETQYEAGNVAPYNPGGLANSDQISSVQDQIKVQDDDGSLIPLTQSLGGSLNSPSTPIVPDSTESSRILDATQTMLANSDPTSSPRELLIPRDGADPLRVIASPSDQPGDRQRALAWIDSNYGTPTTINGAATTQPPSVTNLGQLTVNNHKYDVQSVEHK